MTLVQAQQWGGSRAPARRQGLAISQHQPLDYSYRGLQLRTRMLKTRENGNSGGTMNRSNRAMNWMVYPSLRFSHNEN